MIDGNVVDVVDRDGWHKQFQLLKAIVSIGSDPRNDVVLEPQRGAGVAPRHLQLIAGSAGAGYRLMNMGDTEVRLGEAGDAVLAPRAFVEISTEAQVRVGQFTLTFHGGAQVGGAAVSGRDVTSASIGLTLTLPKTQLGLDAPLDGSLLVRNLGDKTGVQFKLEADGLDPAAVEIGPAPILFPNAEKEVYFRLHHPRSSRPGAGEYRFRMRASAPAAYPGEVTTASAVVQIAPYFNHEMRLVVVE